MLSLNGIKEDFNEIQGDPEDRGNRGFLAFRASP
jgi:hypothetical protein